jgi:hypothetical protein
MHPDPDPLVPGHRSRFGGLWPDRLDAESLLAAKLAAGELDDARGAQIRAWSRDGFLVLPGAVSDELLDEVDADIAATWRGAHPRAHVEYLADASGGFYCYPCRWDPAPPDEVAP